MSICIYIKQKNTVCHIWFMCNTFSDCLKLVLSSTLLSWGIAHVQCYWSCLTWTVAWSWWKDNVTSTFITYCKVSSPSLSITSHTNSHTLTQVTLFTARQLYQWSPPRRTSAGVTDGLSTPRLWPWDFNPPPPSSHISAIKAQYAYNHVLASCFFCVPHDGMCLFSAFSANLDVDAKPGKKTTKITNKKNNKHISKPLRVKFWGEHNINQGCWVRFTARGPSRPLTSS